MQLVIAKTLTSVRKVLMNALKILSVRIRQAGLLAGVRKGLGIIRGKMFVRILMSVGRGCMIVIGRRIFVGIGRGLLFV